MEAFLMKNAKRRSMKKTIIHKRARGLREIKMSGMYRLLVVVAITYSFGGCVKDGLSNTPHPGKGAVEVTTDWTGRSSDAVLPDSYVLRIGAQEQTVSGETNAFDALFPPGKQDLLVYHRTDGITIDGDVATVDTRTDGTLEPLPGYLFAAAETPVVVQDDTVKVTVPMQQYTRTLTLVLALEPGDETRIEGTTATLTGIAPSIDLVRGTLVATGGKTVAPVFAIGTDAGRTRAAGQPVLAATVRMLGTAGGERQVLTLVITRTDGYVQTFTSDLTDALKNFNGTDVEPLELDATLELPKEAGMSGAISGWNVVDNGEIKVD